MDERLRTNDVDVTIGAPRVAIFNQQPSAPTPIDYHAQLVGIETGLLVEIARLQMRVEALERRTFWTMLRDWVKSFWS